MLGVLCGLSALAMVERASALPLVSVDLSLRGLYGSATGDGELNAYGPGIGVRAGVSLPLSLYLGGSYDYFFGESSEVLGVDTSVSISQFMGHIGSNFGLGPISVRPTLGIGLSQATSEVEGGGVSASDSEGAFVLSPGAEVLFSLGLISVSAEARYNAVLDEDRDDAIVVGAGIGVGF